MLIKTILQPGTTYLSKLAAADDSKQSCLLLLPTATCSKKAFYDRSRYINYVITSFIALCLLCTSCSSDKYTKQITQIDSLNTVLDSTFIKLNKLDTTVVQSYYKEYSKNIKLIRENFKEKDNTEIWAVITRYGMLRKPLRDFAKHYLKYSKEISFSRQQLINLKADIRNNVLEKDKISQYILEEAVFVKYIKLSVNDLMENTQNYYNQYLELNPKVEKYFQNAKSNNVIDNNIDDDD